jgi:hypothetical protein
MNATRRMRLTCVAAITCAVLVAPASAQRGGPGGFGGPMQSEIKLVKQFDKDGDKVLNAAERKAALAYLESSGMGGGRGGRGFGRRGGGPTGPVEAGRKLTSKDVPSYPNAPLFDASVFRTFFLTFEDANWEDQMMAFKNTDVDEIGRAHV